MNYKSLLIDRVFFARWIGQPTVPDLENLVQEIRGHYQRVGKKLFFVSYVNKDAEALKSEVRERVQALTPGLLDHCEGIYSIIDGTGVLRTLARVIVRGILVAGGYSGKLFVCHSAEDTFSLFASRLALPAAQVIARARVEGLLP